MAAALYAIDNFQSVINQPHIVYCVSQNGHILSERKAKIKYEYGVRIR